MFAAAGISGNASRRDPGGRGNKRVPTGWSDLTHIVVFSIRAACRLGQRAL